MKSSDNHDYCWNMRHLHIIAIAAQFRLGTAHLRYLFAQHILYLLWKKSEIEKSRCIFGCESEMLKMYWCLPLSWFCLPNNRMLSNVRTNSMAFLLVLLTALTYGCNKLKSEDCFLIEMHLKRVKINWKCDSFHKKIIYPFICHEKRFFHV